MSIFLGGFFFFSFFSHGLMPSVFWWAIGTVERDRKLFSHLHSHAITRGGIQIRAAWSDLDSNAWILNLPTGDLAGIQLGLYPKVNDTA